MLAKSPRRIVPQRQGKRLCQRLSKAAMGLDLARATPKRLAFASARHELGDLRDRDVLNEQGNLSCHFFAVSIRGARDQGMAGQGGGLFLNVLEAEVWCVHRLFE